MTRWRGSSSASCASAGGLSRSRGYILHKGGLKLTKGEKSISLRHPLVVVGKKGGVSPCRPVASATAATSAVGRHHGRRAVVVCRSTFRAVARLSDLTRDGSTATATLKLTKYAARQLNKLAGAQFAHVGDLLGTGKVVVTDSAAPVASPPPVTP